MKEGRSALDRERTKMRERQRRSITTNIFLGLRKHGGYRLSPRADINEVLRHLALEAGWIVEPDGTTYRSTTTSNGSSSGACPLCGGGTKLGAPSITPSLSFFDGGGGECSTTASPRHLASAVRSGGIMATKDTLLAIYMNGAEAQNAIAQQQLYVTVPNQETTAGST